MNGYQMSRLLTDENKSRLSLITYGDVLQIFDDLDVSSCIKGEVVSVIQTYGNEENFHNLVIMEENEWTSLQQKKRDIRGASDYDFTTDQCYKFYSLKAQKAIYDIVRKLSRSKSTTALSFQEHYLTDGCANKVLNMIKLSSKIQRPIVVKSINGSKGCPSDASINWPEKFALINRIQPYRYYIEAKINLYNDVKLSLNQVIETADSAIGTRRSTLSILDACCKITDMYSSVSDHIWETIVESLAKQKSSTAQQEGMAMMDNYKVFTSNLTDAMKNCVRESIIRYIPRTLTDTFLFR